MDKQNILKAILELSSDNAIRSVSNEEIYHKVTGLKNYSRNKWNLLKPILIDISYKEIKLDDVKYLFQGWSPMCAGRYNFYADEAKQRPVAGFTVYQVTK